MSDICMHSFGIICSNSQQIDVFTCSRPNYNDYSCICVVSQTVDFMHRQHVGFVDALFLES